MKIYLLGKTDNVNEDLKHTVPLHHTYFFPCIRWIDMGAIGALLSPQFSGRPEITVGSDSITHGHP